MVKPPSKVRSIRLFVEAWGWLEEEAKRLGISVNALVSSYVDKARRKK